MSIFSFKNLTAVRQALARWGVDERDIHERFILSSGKGGQNINKVATCVQLYHRPSGITVKCHRERSQMLNRIQARMILLTKIKNRLLSQEQARAAQRIRQRRRLRRRSPKAQAALRQEKQRQSQKKQIRRKLHPQDMPDAG